ncbi:MAG: type IVB secretion system lipoprotein DotD [Gammaproteobacteria bacterium]|nr:type IVB secretion system lipoprotein DotD [Gammaproteobacteria bacterium]
MRTRIAVFLLCPLVFMLSACASKPNLPGPPSVADSSLSEASYAVSRGISSLSETAQAAHPEVQLAPPPDPRAYGMGNLTSIDWSGPVEPVLSEMARATGYRLRVLGKAPAIPLMVSVYDKNMMMGDILRDVGYQCGRRASVVVFPETRVIELRYAKN